MSNSQKNYEGKSIYNTYFGGAFRAGVRAEQPLDIATCCPNGLYSSDFDDAYRVLAMEDARCGIVAWCGDGYNYGHTGIEYPRYIADSLLPPSVVVCADRIIANVEGGGYPFNQTTRYAISSLFCYYDSYPLATILLCGVALIR